MAKYCVQRNRHRVLPPHGLRVARGKPPGGKLDLFARRRPIALYYPTSRAGLSFLVLLLFSSTFVFSRIGVFGCAWPCCIADARPPLSCSHHGEIPMLRVACDYWRGRIGVAYIAAGACCPKSTLCPPHTSRTPWPALRARVCTVNEGAGSDVTHYRTSTPCPGF